MLEASSNVCNRAYSGKEGNEEAKKTESLEKDPLGAPWPHLGLNEVHRDGEVNGEGPEGGSSEEAEHRVEKGQQRRHAGGQRHHRRPQGYFRGRHAHCPASDGHLVDYGS